VEQHAAAGDDRAVDLHDPLATALAVRHGGRNLLGRSDAPERGTIYVEHGRRVIAEHDPLRSDLARIRQAHDGRQRVARLHLERFGSTGGEERLEELERP